MPAKTLLDGFAKSKSLLPFSFGAFIAEAG
jgi:hypothetical protein